MVAAFVKGSIAFGFPTLATPLLVLAVDMQTAVAISIIPNIVMDGIQSLRRGRFVATARRLAVLLAFGVVGTLIGTRLLVALPPAVAGGVLGGFLLLFVAWNLSGIAVTVSPRSERRLAPVVGVAAGILGGLTNVPGTPLVLYFYALRMEKDEFVRSVAFSFMLYKLMQLGAVVSYGLMTLERLGASLVLTVLALAAFSVGLRVQDALPPKTFNRIVLAFLALLGTSLLIRALR